MCFVQYLSQQLLPLQRETIHLYLAPRGYLHSSAITPNLSRQDLNHSHLFPGAQAWYRTGDILLLQGNSFDTLIQDIKIQSNSQLREQAIAPHIVQDPSPEFIWSAKGHFVPDTVKKQLLTLAPTTLKEAQYLLCLFGFWKQHIPHLQIFLKPLYTDFHQSAHLEWGAYNKKL